MSCNVKPGDIARIIRGINPNRLVSVDSKCTCPDHAYETGAVWSCIALQRLNYPQESFPAGTAVCIRDAFLQPLHDGDGTDEMVRIAGIPEGVTA